MARSAGSTGPLVFLDVTGHEPGDEISIAANGPRTVRVHASAVSIAPMAQLDIILNGKVARSVAPAGARDSLALAFDDSVAVPEGGWIAARVIGPGGAIASERPRSSHQKG